jgi:hypothetical protein
MSVVRLCVLKLIFFGRFAVFYRGSVSYKLLNMCNLLQVVQAE